MVQTVVLVAIAISSYVAPSALARRMAVSLSTNDNSDALVSSLQGAMALGAMMPDQPEVQKPNKDCLAVMDKAEPLVYAGYEMLQSAQNQIEISLEQMKMNMHVKDAAANLAGGKGVLAEANKKLKEGKKLSDQAISMFQNTADPLGPPPQNPQEWDEINGSLRRAMTKAASIQSTLEEAESTAKEMGLTDAVTTASNGFSVAREKAVEYGKKQDDKLLAFLQQY